MSAPWLESVARGRPAAFAVWAPHAHQVELVLVAAAPGSLHAAADGPVVGHRWPVDAVVPMRRHVAPVEAADDYAGWWIPDAPLEPTLAAVGADPSAAQPDVLPGYGYRVDGADPVPDPRSRWLPDTVHGPSRPDPAADFAWTDRAGEPGGWTGPDGVLADPDLPQGGGLRGAVLYELHLGTFTPGGTLDSAIERLPHLRRLGVTHVELLPVNAVDGPRNWGYDGVAWYAVNQAYGGPAAYRRFVDAAHAAGLGVVQDVVYNHVGPSGNYHGVFGPYTGGGNTGWGDGLNLDGPDSDEVRRHVLDNIAMWIEEFHVDGLRLDAVHALVDSRAVHLLEEAAALADRLCARLGRPVPLMAESDRNDPATVLPRAGGPGGEATSAGLGLAGQWADDVHHAIHVAVTGETHGYYADFASLSCLETTARGVFLHDGRHSSFRGRRHGRPVPDAVPAEAFVVSIQNHDQVGNRAAGDRTGASLSEGALAAAAALLLTGPGTPMLFMGEEFAASTPFPFFTSFPDEDLAEAVRTGRRREFAAHGWDPAAVPDPQAPETFASAVLDWQETDRGRGARILACYRELIGLRRSLPALTNPDRSATVVTVDEQRRHVRWDRSGVAPPTATAQHASTGQTVTLLAALGDAPMIVPRDLREARVLVGHGDDGPLASGVPPRTVSAPGFVLLG